MHTILLFSIRTLLLANFFLFSLASPNINSLLLYQICGDVNYTANSTYESNLQFLFSSLNTKTAVHAGFSKNIIGSLPNQIFGLFLCRGDVNSSVCGTCLNQSFTDAVNLCSYNKRAIIYYDYCLLRYSNENFFNGSDNSENVFSSFHTQDVTGGRFKGWEWDPSNNATKFYFNTVLNTLLSDVSDWAAYKSTTRFGTGEIELSLSIPIIYGLAQCDPDMQSINCRWCLQGLIDEAQNLLYGRLGGRFLGFLCNFRYEIYPFLDEDSILQIRSMRSILTQPGFASGNTPTIFPVTTPLVKYNKDDKGGISKQVILIVSILPILLLVLCSCIIVRFFWIRKNRHADTSILSRSEEVSSEFSLVNFSQITKATNNFCSDNKLGQGGFGPVYKGVLEDGQEIAVKRLSAQSGQGLVEFKNEIQLIAKLQHKNLVRLIGWCVQGEEKILIYEFMTNKSLDFFIFDTARGATLNWEKRFEIIEGISQGLLYLHKHSRLRIIHRDLKASNILLDSEMVPKISDFGLARIFGPKELEANTNRVVGTYGYMAPEYASEGHFSIKSDVFSFGVLLLEIVCGKRNIGFHKYGDFLNLIGYVWNCWREGKWFEVISPSLIDPCQSQIERCVHVALLCIQENPVDRPNMSDVISFLSTESIILPEPQQPAYFNFRIAGEAVRSSELNAKSCSVNSMTLSNPDGR